jgi:predicted RNA binding protein YcfA (HicA-like mRNA interferase family)
MPLPILKSRQVVAALKRAGFSEHHQTGSHLCLLNEDTGRRVTVPIHVGDVPKGTLRAILQQAGLTEEDFRNYL